MRNTTFLMFALFTFILNSCSTLHKGKSYKNLPSIKASKEVIDYKIGDQWVYGMWSIAPQVENDTLTVTCFGEKETFIFRTNEESIKLEIEPGSSENFYVNLNDSLYAHTIITGVAFQPNKIKYDPTNGNGKIKVLYQEGQNKYLSDLKKQYPLDFITEDMSDKEIALAVMNWTRKRWEHDGNNSPSKNDAITILNEVDAGGRFPCFAYAVVLRDQLTTLGYKARTIYLKTQDAATRLAPPGHVATEVFLNDIKKWVLIDAQFNVMPTLDGVPLNTVEFQNAINDRFMDFELATSQSDPISKRNYVNFVYDYLYYLDTSLDNTYNITERHRIDGKRSMMLVPEGAEELSHIDFWDMEVDYCLYTNSLADFYKAPN